MTIAPDPKFPERPGSTYDRKMASATPGMRGPLRFEEGVATDTDVPNDFARGAYADTAPSPIRMNHNNPEMFYKYPEETMRERAHVGSASWIEAPDHLREFVMGSMAGDNMPQFEYSYNTGGKMNLPNKTTVSG